MSLERYNKQYSTVMSEDLTKVIFIMFFGAIALLVMFGKRR